ncbi:hypothetical protein N7497_003956 [Penicillium chrysogenum]|nr:hypothetical protein N7497_003956 [Penicillium chrysogenum]
MSGHDYNTVLSVTIAGMAVGQLPHGIIIQRVPPRIWFPLMVVIWAGLTCSSEDCNAAMRDQIFLGE